MLLKTKGGFLEMFVGMNPQKLEEIKKRLKAELKDKNLPKQRKEEVLSYLYYISSWIIEKKGVFRK